MIDEEEWGHRLLAPLRGEDGVPPGPAAVDVPAAVATGRRRVRVRRLLAGGAAAAVVLVAAAAVPVAADALRGGAPARQGVAVAPATATPSPGASPEEAPAPPTACTVELLPDPDATGRSVVTGMDPTGRMILGRVYPGGERRQVVVWVDGVPQKVRVPGADQSFVDANSSGAAVGLSYARELVRGWLYRDGEVRELRGPSPVTPAAIGENGVIVGSRDGAPSPKLSRGGEPAPVFGNPVPVIWRNADEPAVDLPLPGGSWYGRAVDVAADGTVLGVLTQRRYELSRAVLWGPDGAVTMLPLPEVDGRAADGFAPVAVGERWVIGPAVFTEPNEKGYSWSLVRYDRHTGEFRSYPEGGFQVNGANAHGWLAGEVEHDRPAVLTDGGIVELPEFANLTRHVALVISEDGRTVGGQAVAKGDAVRAVVWRCR